MEAGNLSCKGSSSPAAKEEAGDKGAENANLLWECNLFLLAFGLFPLLTADCMTFRMQCDYSVEVLERNVRRMFRWV